jgi:transposase
MPSSYLGLDVHKVRTQYCLMDPGGEILAEGNLPTETVAGVVPGSDCAVVLEATGSWHHAYDALCASGAAVKLAHPAHVKAIASARVKTDKIDARIFAHLLRCDLIPEAWAPPVRIRELRDLVRLRWRFVSQRTTAKNRISNLLARKCLRYDGTDLFGAGGRTWLAELPLDTHARTLTELLLASINEADAHVAALTDRLHELLDGDDELRLLMSIPGVGFITAATLLAELGDWRRFGSAAQVSAYFGIVPSVRASAAVAHYGRITRAASPHARRALVEAAHVAVRLPGPARARYASLARRRGKKVALVAAARVLLELSWTLLRRGEVFRAAGEQGEPVQMR